jgi:hypothetical protein
VCYTIFLLVVLEIIIYFPYPLHYLLLYFIVIAIRVFCVIFLYI